MSARRITRFDWEVSRRGWCVTLGWVLFCAGSCGIPQQPQVCEHFSVQAPPARTVDCAPSSNVETRTAPSVDPLVRAGPDAAVPMVLLLSIDGLMPLHVRSADALGIAVPNLQRFLREGSFAEGVRGVAPSLTYPAHTTLITGCGPMRHGITMNLTFDPVFRNQKGWFWYTADIRVATLWSAAHEASLATANLFWPTSVGAPVDFNVPQYWRASLPDDGKLYSALSTPGLLDELARQVGPVPYGEDFSLEAEELRTRFAEYVLSHRRPVFTTVYLGAFDEAEHRVGPKGKHAIDVLTAIDGMVGRLRAALESVAGSNYLMSVVSDHGFVEYGTEIHQSAMLRQAGLIKMAAENRVKSWRAAAWTAGGTGAIYLRDQSDEGARRIVERLIAELRVDRHCGVARIYRANEIDALQGFAGASYVIALRKGCKFGQNLLGSARLPKSGGTHGYLPEDPEMDATFMMVGRGVPAGRSLGRIDMRAIAPTLASSIGVTLPDAEVAGIDASL